MERNWSISVQSGFFLIWEIPRPIAVVVASFGHPKTGPWTLEH
jgi:hypothetical protein